MFGKGEKGVKTALQNRKEIIRWVDERVGQRPKRSENHKLQKPKKTEIKVKVK